ncbi:MAG TPA: SDR family oxidoreductase [Mycobacterium sp.]|jgi:NAD(P)-dependent dehydrogenase (short-subunit alcohol dehydrogenase family)|nr:SDR family oxidoreductase [Mycobacterium sp.]
MDLKLNGKRAVVTGGSGGIGKAVARCLTSEGVAVVIGSRKEEPLKATAAELSTGGARVIPITVDTGDDGSVEAFVAKAVRVLGGIDILVNGAAHPSGHAKAPGVLEVTGAEFFDDMNIKVLGYLRMIRAVAPVMKIHGWGRVINIDGLGSRMTGSVLTSMRNAAVVALTKNAADELGSYGINVSGVSPGPVRTEATRGALSEQAHRKNMSVAELEVKMAEVHSIGRIVTADEVASLVTWLASPLSIAVTGDVVACGGGVKGAIYY